MPEDMKDALRLLSSDDDKVRVDDLVAGAQALMELRKTTRWLRKASVGLCAVAAVLLAGGFYLTQAALEGSKEMHVAGQGGGLVTPSGEEVQIASAEMAVGPDGDLVSRSTGRLLGGGSQMVKAGIHRPLVRGLAYRYARRLEESNETEVPLDPDSALLVLPQDAALEALEELRQNGALEFVAALPGEGGHVATKVDFFNSDGNTSLVAEGYGKTFDWSMQCDGSACSVDVRQETTSTGRLLQSRTVGGVPGGPERHLAYTLFGKEPLPHVDPCLFKCRCSFMIYVTARYPAFHPCNPTHSGFQSRFCDQDTSVSSAVRTTRRENYDRYCPHKGRHPSAEFLRGYENGNGMQYRHTTRSEFHWFQDELWPWEGATSACCRGHEPYYNRYQAYVGGTQKQCPTYWPESATDEEIQLCRDETMSKRMKWLEECGNGP